MPMYEYGCQACDTRFDLLRRMDQGDTGIVCPRCKSDDVRRRLSVFAPRRRRGERRRDRTGCQHRRWLLRRVVWVWVARRLISAATTESTGLPPAASTPRGAGTTQSGTIL
jgi:putative FmdB family regulatory protein